MFYATSSQHLFGAFSQGLKTTQKSWTDFSTAAAEATKNVQGEGKPVVLEAAGVSSDDIAFVHIYGDGEWITVAPESIRKIVSSITPSTVYKVVVALSSKGQVDSWNWSCPIDEIEELKNAISDATCPANKKFASLPAPLNYQFALADIKPEYRIDAERKQIGDTNLVTANGDWVWTKTAAVTLDVTPIGDEGIEAYFGIQDLDRSATDRFDCYVSLAKTLTGYDLGFQINASQLGVASNVCFWHYRGNEYKIAKKSFHEIKEKVHDFIRQYELEKRPFAILGPEIKSILRGIDLDHREGIGVFLVQESFKIPIAGNWCETLYGNRYPEYTVSNMSEGDFSDKATYKQEEQKSQAIDINNTSDPRQTTYKLKYASTDTAPRLNPLHHPLLKSTAVTNFQKYLGKIVQTHVPTNIVIRLLSALDNETMPVFLESLSKKPCETLSNYVR